MFLRFTVPSRDPDSQSPLGIFRVAGDFVTREECDRETARHIHDILEWYNTHLKIPPKRYREMSPRAISWFKPQAKKSLRYTWDLVAVLKENGIPVDIVKTDDPGTVLYEHGFQVFAVPKKQDRMK